MTCIVGLIGENGDIWLGADTLALCGQTRMACVEKLIVLGNGMAGGSTGDCRGGDILYNFRPPERAEKEDVLRYMIGSFVPALRTHYESADFLTRPKEHAPAIVAGNTQAIIAYDGHLFSLGYDFSIVKQNDYIATGSGLRYAMGAFATTRAVVDNRERLLTVLRATVICCTSVSAPFDIWKINGIHITKERVEA